ncbi:ABC transporter ATP-binding protein [Hyphomicrobium sulfonivorans]|uniref:ABC transporter ATP-binding protein n=1 Tax=Hyphomicrobium sulfonivorans TaxID=121290 RepID=UPI0015715AE8|nr:ABC transporter ATP-binding protein [Hyphomicrobium sulfonivorans]MBI1649112.1 ABC transporter ATP-binding protein [Hyphomicrobium sulfonivorans]NSL70357.1 ABC transporter ATP-binding protein [Hyphomicrobium sulfonivorans]
MVTLKAQEIVVRLQARTLLHGASFTACSGESIAIIGPNGAGKSTLLKSLAGLLRPASGSTTYDDAPISSMTAAGRASVIGYVPQHFNPHWDIQVTDLMQISLERSRASVQRGTLDAALRTHDIEPLRDRWWSTLSGGERNRVLLAMVLATAPPVLLADEPAANLDPRCRLEMVERLSAYGRTALSIVVMHDIDLAFRYFDRILLLNDGRIVADGATAEVYDAPILEDVFGVSFIRSQHENVKTIHPGNVAPTR